MKKLAVALFVLSVPVYFAAPVCAHGRGGFHGGRFGHFGGGHFSRGLSHPGAFRGGFGSHSHRGLGTPHFRHHGSGHFGHFRHERFFGPHHHLGHGGFSFHSFGTPWGFGFRSFGFSGGSFSSRTWVGPAGTPPLGAPGPPPLGAPGPTPFPSPHPPTVVINSPFFCFPHGLGFTDQTLFLDHLQHLHSVPPRRAFSFCTPVAGGSRWIFFGF